MIRPPAGPLLRVSVVGLLLLSGFIPVSAQEPGGAAHGALVVIGGALSPDNEAVYRAILDARHGEGPVCAIGTASADPEGSSRAAVERLDRWGGAGTGRAHPLSSEDPEAARDPGLLAALAECSGFFFTGGVQSRIVALFRPGGGGPGSPAEAVVVARWKEGAVVAGTSAGAAMMSDPMIAGGTSHGAFLQGLGEGGVNLAPGLGFLPDLLVDQHFLARGRIGRLLVAALEPGGVPLAAGVDENTALVVRGTDLHVVGASGVVMVDARGAAPLADAPAGAGARGVRLELLGPGDRFSTLPDARVRPASGGITLSPGPPGDGEGSEVDLFEPWAFLRFVGEVGRAPEGAGIHGPSGVTVAVEGGGHLAFRAAGGFRALVPPGGNGEGTTGTALGLSVGPFLVEVRRGVPE